MTRGLDRRDSWRPCSLAIAVAVAVDRAGDARTTTRSCSISTPATASNCPTTRRVDDHQRRHDRLRPTARGRGVRDRRTRSRTATCRTPTRTQLFARGRPPAARRCSADLPGARRTLRGAACRCQRTVLGSAPRPLSSASRFRTAAAPSPGRSEPERSTDPTASLRASRAISSVG